MCTNHPPPQTAGTLGCHPSPRARSPKVSVLAYANDFIIVTNAPQNVAPLLATLQDACKETGFAVSAEKTLIAAWTPDDQPLPPWHMDGKRIPVEINSPIKILGITLDRPVCRQPYPQMLRAHQHSKSGAIRAKQRAMKVALACNMLPNSLDRQLFYCSPRAPIVFGRELAGLSVWQLEFSVTREAACDIVGIPTSTEIQALSTMIEAHILPPGVQLAIEYGEALEHTRALPATNPTKMKLVADVQATMGLDPGSRTTARGRLSRDTKALLLLGTSCVSPFASFLAAMELLDLDTEILNIGTGLAPYEPRPQPPPGCPPLRSPRKLITEAYGALWNSGALSADSPSLEWYHSLVPSLPSEPQWYHKIKDVHSRHAFHTLRLAALPLADRTAASDARRGLAPTPFVCLKCHGRPLRDHLHLITTCTVTKPSRARLSRLMRATCASSALPLAASILQRIDRSLSVDGTLSASAHFPLAVVSDAWHRWLLGGDASNEAASCAPFQYRDLPRMSSADRALCTKLRSHLPGFASSVVRAHDPADGSRMFRSLGTISASTSHTACLIFHH